MEKNEGFFLTRVQGDIRTEVMVKADSVDMVERPAPGLKDQGVGAVLFLSSGECVFVEEDVMSLMKAEK